LLLGLHLLGEMVVVYSALPLASLLDLALFFVRQQMNDWEWLLESLEAYLFLH
jgi:hypothetical protein